MHHAQRAQDVFGSSGEGQDKAPSVARIFAPHNQASGAETVDQFSRRVRRDQEHLGERTHGHRAVRVPFDGENGLMLLRR